MTSPTQCDVPTGSLPGRPIFRGSVSARSLTAQGSVEPGSRVSPDAIAFSGREAEHLGRLFDGQPGEVMQLDQLGGLRFLEGESLEGLVHGQQFLRWAVDREDGLVQIDPPLRPPCLTRRFRRAFSTRIRRMASAAAPKKWPRPFHGLETSPPTRRR